MSHRARCGRVNVKLIILLVLVTVAAGVSLVVARQTRRSILAGRDLAAGETAFEKKDWPAAVKSYRSYLARNPDDVGILRKYAESCLSIRPFDATAAAGAVSAYRRIAQLAPLDKAACEKLVMLYGTIGNFEELVSLARARLERDPNDRQAPLWLANALARLKRVPEARQTLQSFIAKLEALPDKHIEYVQACMQLSQLTNSENPPQPTMAAGGATSPQPQAAAEGGQAPPTPQTPMDWLNKAAAYSPDSVEVLLARAQFQRRMASMSDTSEQDRSSLMTLAHKDLEAADAQGTENPRIRYSLGVEWLAHGELERTAAELQILDKLPSSTLGEQFLDIGSWTVARFLLASELATRQRAVTEGASLADETLKSLTEKRHRIQALPIAVPLYVAAGRIPEARRSLDEYLDLVRAQEGQAELPPRLAWLQALVAGAENRPRTVIDTLEPLAGSDSSGPGLWKLLAEAYDQTGQTRRAVNALVRYRQLNPQDAWTIRELATQYSKLGDWTQVLETARAAETLGSTDLALKLLRIGAGINLAAAGQRDATHTQELDKLSTELADLRRANPDQTDVRILQAAVAEVLGQPQKAQDELKRAVDECKEPLKAEMQLAAHYLRTKQMKEAVGVCETACKRHSEAAEPWLSLADVHAANADYESARRSLRQGLDAVSAPREKRSLSIKLALLELTRGDRPTGISLLKGLASQDQQEIQARLLLLGTREIQEDPVAAQTLVDELRQAEGQSGLWWRLHQASVWLSSEGWSAKQQDIASRLQYCIGADPAWSAPVLLLAAMYERLGDFTRVEDTCRQGLLANPLATDIADRLLALFERQGRFSDAEKMLQQTQINPQVASAWQVRMALGSKDFSRAIDELRLRASNNDRDASSRIQLARLLYQETNDANQALGYLKQAEAIDPNSRTLVAVRASILRKEGKKAEALGALDRYVADHNDFDAYLMRATYLAEEGALDRAEQDYKRLPGFAGRGAVGCELLGGFYASTGRLDQGVTTIQKGLDAYPDDIRLKRRLMQLLFQRAGPQDRANAVQILGVLEERFPQDIELTTIRALQTLAEPTPESLSLIRTRLENAVKLAPKAVNTHLALVAVAMRQEEYKVACDYAAQALESNPGHPALLSARARAELALGYVPMAVRLAREALQRDPNNTEAASVIVDGALRSGQRDLLEEARTLLGSALGRSPTSEKWLISQAHVLTALAQPKEAIAPLEAYCQGKEGGRSIAAVVTLADLYRLANDADRAKQWIEQAERLDASLQAVVHARFLWLVSQNRLDELAHISSAYLSAKGQDPGTVLRAASILSSLDSMDLKKEAVKLFEHAAALAPTLLDARLGLASSLYQTGDAGGAEKVYRGLLQQRPDDVRILNDLAWILQEHDQRYAEALELANKGLRLAPGDLHLLDTRGTILSNMPDRLADANSDLEELLKLSSSDVRRQASTLLKLGRNCANLGDLPKVKQHLERAMEIDRTAHVFTPKELSDIAEIVQRSGSSAQK